MTPGSVGSGCNFSNFRVGYVESLPENQQLLNLGVIRMVPPKNSTISCMYPVCTRNVTIIIVGMFSEKGTNMS